MIEAKAPRKIIIVQDFSDEDSPPIKTSSSNHAGNNQNGNTSIAASSQHSNPKLIQIKSKSNLNPTQETQKQAYYSPKQFSKRTQHDVFSASDDDQPEEYVQEEIQIGDKGLPNKPTNTIQSSYGECLYTRGKRGSRQQYEKVQETTRGLYSRGNRPNRQVKMQEESEEQQSDVSSEEYEDKFEAEQKKEEPSLQKQKTQLKPIKLHLDQTQAAKLITQPLPQAYKLTFIIHIQKSLLGISTKYHLMFKNDSTQAVLSAKKELVSLSPSYIISKSKLNHSRRSADYVAHLMGSFTGSEWVLQTPKSANNQQHEVKFLAKYGPSLMGSNSIRSMQAYKQDPAYRKKHKYSITEKVNANKPIGLTLMKTLAPTLHNGKYRIDFHGLAKMPSNKNFILSFGEESKECLLLAKQNENAFLMEVRYPLTVLEAFGLCLSSLDSKILVN